MVPRSLRFLSLLFVCSLATTVMAQSADLSVTLSMPPTAVYSAMELPFSPVSEAAATGQFTVTNAGPSIAQNVTIDFGANASNVSLAGFTCATANSHYLCTAASMAPGSLSASVRLQWPLAANGTVETTTLTVSSSSPADPNAANNSASANTTVIWQADVELSDNGSGYPPAPPGGYYNVYAFFSNYGPSPADVKVTLTVPPGATYVSYLAQGLTCTEPPKGGLGDLVCTGANLGLGGGYEADLFVRFDPTAVPGTVITFPITLTSTTATKPTQTTSTSVSIVEPADLHVEMSAPASVNAGDTFLSTITVTNRGPGVAIGPRVTYSNPGFSQGRMTGPADWGCYYSCSMNSIGVGPTTTFAPGATATFTVPITVPLNATAGTLTAKATADAYNVPYSESADGVATASTVIIAVPIATLKLTMSASSNIAYSADQFTYTATIANTSNADAQNVTLTWQLDGNAVATTCGNVSDTACTFPTIAAGTTQTVTRTIRVGARPGGLLDSKAKVTATNVIYDSSNDFAELSTKVEAPSLQVNLAASIIVPPGVRAGATGSWIYRVANLGPGTATDWQLSLTLPSNTTLADSSIDPGQGTCTGLTVNAAGSAVTCHGTNLAALSHVDLRLSLSVSLGTAATIHASATVSTSNFDTNPQDDIYTLDLDFVAPNLSASMTSDKTTAMFGELVMQTLTVTNTGPTATGMLINLTLPAAPIDGIKSSTYLPCTGTTSASIRCTGALENGATLTATFSFHAPASAGPWKTEADVQWSGTETVAVVYLQVVPPTPTSDMTIALDAAPTTLNTGDTVTYTIATTNLGNAPAANVTAELDLPPSLAFVSASPQCSGGPLVRCSAGTVASGTPATFTVTARALETGTIKVLASVSTTSEESSNGNNTAAATIIVNAPPTPSRRRAARH